MNDPCMKQALMDVIRKQLKERLDRLTRAAKESQQAATDPDSKAESKYDTRNLEASYLAVGQAKQVEGSCRRSDRQVVDHRAVREAEVAGRAHEPDPRIMSSRAMRTVTPLRLCWK